MNLTPAKNVVATFERLKRLARFGKGAAGAILLLNPLLISTAAAPHSESILTTVRGVHRLVDPGKSIACGVRLEGTVLWESPDRDQFIMQDDSGGMRIEMDLRSQAVLKTGQQILLEGRGLVGPNGFREALVNNDGIHNAIERSQTLYLTAGRHAIRLDWFNALGLYELDVDFQGPGLLRQRIPDAALFRLEKDAGSGGTNWANGLNYQCYEGSWDRVPNFRELPVCRSGIVPNFDLAVRTRDVNVGLQFEGFVEVPRAGLYTFWTKTDDGSRLFVDNSFLRVDVLSGLRLPTPRRIFTGQPLDENQDCQWSMIEGTITFVNDRSGSLNLELNSGMGLMDLEVADRSGGSPRLLLGSRVRVTGVSQSTFTIEGQRIAGTLLVPSLQQIETLDPASALWTEYPILPIGQLANTNLFVARDSVVHVCGKICSFTPSKFLSVEDATGRILVETTHFPPENTEAQIEALGQLTRVGMNLVLQNGFYRSIRNPTKEITAELPLLTGIERVKSLSREEAQNGYPVKIRGIVTAPTYGGFFIQDSAWAIFVRSEGLTLADAPRTGDYWEVEGVTYAEFSPNIRATRAVRLGTGVLPAPLRPAWDQLANGSLDTRYIEVQGIVTATEPEILHLLTHSGSVEVHLTDVDPAVAGTNQNNLEQYENNLIRVRGCVIPGRDSSTEQIQMGYFWLCNYSITVDQPAPLDPFSAPLKSISDLRLFDSHASILQRVKVEGQILHQQDHEFFLWDGANGLRFIPGTPVQLAVGDRVEVVGFPDLGDSSPILREALTRRTGHAALPSPTVLSNELLLKERFDRSLVRVRARLTDVNTGPREQILTLQAGAHGFVARLDDRGGLRGDLLPGSEVELTGLYVGKGGSSGSGADIVSFELLLNSPGDITVLERPSWWTLRRFMAAFGAVAVVLAGAVFWIFTLKRQVNAQTRLIHQKVEREATLEERARIARDIHDTLEQALAGTSLQLSALAGSLSNASPEPARILTVARSMVHHAQEEARRTVRNLRFLDLEKHDLPTALTHLAAQSGSEAPVEIRVTANGTVKRLSSQVESHLLRISQEAITNALKHGRAPTIRLDLAYESAWLQLTIQDNGCGFDTAHAAPATTGHFGLLGMRERAEKISGTLVIQSVIGQGTTIQVKVPLPTSTPAASRLSSITTGRNKAE